MTGTRTVNYSWEALVRRADPDFYRTRANEPEYEFRGRTFHANRAVRGAYAPFMGLITDQGLVIAVDDDGDPWPGYLIKG